MSEYRTIPEEDRRKAKAFFERGTTVANTGNYEYAIEMYIQGLSIDPEAVEAHKTLRDISLRRKATGGKPMGFMERMKLKTTKDDKQNMLNAEKMLAYDPGNLDHMTSLLQNAHRAGFYDTVLWIGAILQTANAASPKPEYAKFIILKDIYKSMASSGELPQEIRPELWKRATEACHYAAMIRPDDMDLQTELKNLGAQHTMDEGRYGSATSFRESIRDMERQKELMEQDSGVRTDEAVERVIRNARAEYEADPEEPGKIMRYVEALRSTGDLDHENKAIDLLDAAYRRTKQFRFRYQIGLIKIAQLSRTEKSMRAAVNQNPEDEQLRADYAKFLKDRAEEELKEYRLFAENYPTDLTHKFEIGRRLFALGKFDEAIPVFQQARADAKLRIEASLALGQAFLQAGFPDEAVETLKGLIESYQIKDDDRGKRMHYWYGRALEAKGDAQAAIRAYSTVAQADFNFLDVQKRIRELRAKQQAQT